MNAPSVILRKRSTEKIFETRMKIVVNPSPRMRYSFRPAKMGAIISHATDAEYTFATFAQIFDRKIRDIRKNERVDP